MMADKDNSVHKPSALPDGGVLFRVSALRGFMFRQYPAGVTPPDGFVGFITDGRRQVAAQYRDGRWQNQAGRPITWEPTHWTALESHDVG